MQLLLIIFAFALVAAAPPRFSPPGTAKAAVVLEDFEKDTPGDWPKNWRFLASSDRSFKPLGAMMNDKEKFVVVTEGGNKFVRAYTEGEAQRVSFPPSKFSWRLSDHPVISWEWRSLRLPEGAGGSPLEDPYTITLWSDSDDTKSIFEVDFDNLEIRKAGK